MICQLYNRKNCLWEIVFFYDVITTPIHDCLTFACYIVMSFWCYIYDVMMENNEWLSSSDKSKNLMILSTKFNGYWNTCESKYVILLLVLFAVFFFASMKVLCDFSIKVMRFYIRVFSTHYITESYINRKDLNVDRTRMSAIKKPSFCIWCTKLNVSAWMKNNFLRDLTEIYFWHFKSPDQPSTLLLICQSNPFWATVVYFEEQGWN